MSSVNCIVLIEKLANVCSAQGVDIYFLDCFFAVNAVGIRFLVLDIVNLVN